MLTRNRISIDCKKHECRELAILDLVNLLSQSAGERASLALRHRIGKLKKSMSTPNEIASKRFGIWLWPGVSLRDQLMLR